MGVLTKDLINKLRSVNSESEISKKINVTGYSDPRQSVPAPKSFNEIVGTNKNLTSTAGNTMSDLNSNYKPNLAMENKVTKEDKIVLKKLDDTNNSTLNKVSEAIFTNPIVKTVLDNPVTKFIDTAGDDRNKIITDIVKTALDNPITKFINATGEYTHKAITGYPAHGTEIPSLGNKYADVAANLVGSIASYAIPTGAESSILSASNRIGSKVADSIASKIGLGSKLGDKVAKGILEGVATGAPLTAVSSVLETQNKPISQVAKEFPKKLLEESAIGGAIGGAIPLAGKAISKTVETIKNKSTNVAPTMAELNPTYAQATETLNKDIPLKSDNINLKQLNNEGNINSLPKQNNALKTQTNSFDNIKTVEQLPNNEEGLKEYIKQAQDKQKVGIKVDLQLFAEAQKKLENLSKFYTNTLLQKSKTLTDIEKEELPAELFVKDVSSRKQVSKKLDEVLNNSNVENETFKLFDKETWNQEDVVKAKKISDKILDEARKNDDYEYYYEFLSNTKNKATKSGQSVEAWKEWQEDPIQGTLLNAKQAVDSVENEIAKVNPKKIKDIDTKVKEIENTLKEIESKATNQVADEISKHINDIIENSSRVIKDKPIVDAKYEPDIDLSTRIIKATESIVLPREREVVQKVSDEVMKQMKSVKELYGKFKQTLDDTKTPKNNSIKNFAEAVKNRQISGEVWSKAKTIVRDFYKNDKEAQVILDKYFGTGTKPPFTQKTLNKAFNQGVNELGLKLKDIVKQYYSIGKKSKETLVDYIVKESGLTGEDAKVLSNYVENRFKQVRKEIAEQYKNTVFKEKVINKVNGINVKDIEALANVGTFQDKRFIDKIADKLNPKIRKIIKENGIDLKNLIIKSNKLVKQAKENFINDLASKLNIKPDDIERVIRVVEDEFDKIIEEKRLKTAENRLKPKKSIEKKSLFDNVMELINLGAYNKESLRDLIKQKEGLPILTSSDIKFITKTMDNISNLNNNSYEYRKELSKVQTLIANKIPSDFNDKFKGLQRISMLLNPKTLISRNPLPNVFMGALEEAKDIPGTLIDKSISSITGKRTTSIIPVKYIEQHKGFIKGLKEFYLDLKNNVDTNPTNGQIELPKGRIFDNKVLNALDKVTRKALQLGDRPFYEAAYQGRLAELKKMNKSDIITDEIKLEARLYALERVFQNDSEISKMLSGLKTLSDKKSYQTFINLILPYTQTPGNILDKILDYSPVGFIKAMTHLGSIAEKGVSNKLKSEMFNQKLFVDRLSRGLTGTGLGILGYVMAKNGMITGKSNEDKDVANFEQALGKNQYSFKIGDKYYSYDWANPSASMLALGADVYYGGKDKKDFISSLTSGAESAGNTFFKQSVLQGLTNLFSGYSPTAGITKALLGSTTQTTPTLSKQIAQYIDPITRETYDSNLIKQTANKLISRIPGASTTLPPKINTMGEEVKNFQGNNSFYNVFINPGFNSEFKPNAVQKEILRIYESTNDKTIFPRVADKSITYKPKGKTKSEKVQLSSDEYVQYQKLLGQKTMELFKNYMNSNSYRLLKGEKADEVRAKKLSDLITKANDYAKKEILKQKRLISASNARQYSQLSKQYK